MSALGPFTLEVGLGVLLLIVFVAGLASHGEDRRGIGWIATGGVLVLAALALVVRSEGA